MAIVAGVLFLALLLWAACLLGTALIGEGLRVADYVRKSRASTTRAAERVERERRYRAEIEPRHRSHRPGYPPDWEIRRALVFLRDRGMCSECQSFCATTSHLEERLWARDPELLEPKDRFVSGGHVHHITPVSEGGDHSLGNLTLTCALCHAKEHEGNVGLRTNAEGETAARVQRWMDEGEHIFKDSAREKVARKEWTCRVCEGPIRAGDRYFGMAALRVCRSCRTKHGFH